MKNNHEEFVKENVTNKELQDTILDFIEMRKSIKKPMTERAVKILINKLPRLSTSVDMQIKIIEQSIINNWTDIYPLKSDFKQQNNFTTIY